MNTTYPYPFRDAQAYKFVEDYWREQHALKVSQDKKSFRLGLLHSADEIYQAPFQRFMCELVVSNSCQDYPYDYKVLEAAAILFAYSLIVIPSGGNIPND